MGSAKYFLCDISLEMKNLMAYGLEILSIIEREKLAHGEIEFIGCLEDEIEQLKQSQHVDFMPEMYLELMRFMGHSGIIWFLGGESDYDFVRELKNQVMGMNHVSEFIPTSAFIFMGELDAYFFFDPKDHNQNPEVYMYFEDAITKTANTLSEFLDNRIRILREERQRRIETESRSVYYDPDTDSFYTKSLD
jgi:hypothetical protein